MVSLVALCMDEISMAHPELIGLEGERLAAQAWLRLFSSGAQMRAFLRNDRQVDEVWVVSCDDVEPINLAATIKEDRGELRVCLITFQGTGSLRSRAAAASVDVMLTRQALATRYAAFKRVRSASTSMPPKPDARPALSSAEAPEELFLPEEPCPMEGVAVLREPAAGAADWPAPKESEKASPTITVNMDGEASREALLLPIVSGSGGAGKSAVAALMAFAAQRAGLKTLLLDFDLQFGDMREMTAQPEALGIDEAIADPSRLARLAPADGVPAVLGAPRHLEEAESLARQAPALLDALRSMFDVIVANTGAAWAEQHAVLLERCSKALFLIDQRGSSLRACHRALDLCARCGIAVNPFLFAVNFCTKNAPLTSIDVSCALRGAEVHELVDGGAEVEEVLSEGRPADLLDTGNPFAESVRRLLPSLVPSLDGRQENQDAAFSAFGSLFRRRKRRRRGVA